MKRISDLSAREFLAAIPTTWLIYAMVIRAALRIGRHMMLH